jgi:D-sedoheptulose 7-phosphate isomerase
MNMVATEHLAALRDATAALEAELPRVERWGRELAAALLAGRRLLVAGNGGSAAEAQHLTAELVGRYCDERAPLSAIALHSETSALTAIANDYGYDDVYARQVQAHGRPGDVLVALSTSGRSANVVNAAATGRRSGLRVWALTGPAPNPLAEAADYSIAIAAPSPTVQELHLVAVHLLCAAVDDFVRTATGDGEAASLRAPLAEAHP